ncbi:hypothetical protein ACLKA7_015362 [Drosophila subpalustris]
MAEIAVSFKRMVETSHRHFVSQQTKVQVAKREIKVECEDLELNDICDLIDFEDLAMEDTQSKEYNNNGHHYNTRGKERRENKPPNRELSSNATQESFTCPYCKFDLSTKGNLKTHIRTHTGERPFSSFFESDSLTRHERPQHSLQ